MQWLGKMVGEGHSRWVKEMVPKLGGVKDTWPAQALSGSSLSIGYMWGFGRKKLEGHEYKIQTMQRCGCNIRNLDSCVGNG